MSPFAQASLIEARKLVTEARVSLECVDHEWSPKNASDDISEDSGLLDPDDKISPKQLKALVSILMYLHSPE